MRPIPRQMGLAVLLAMTGFAAFGFFAIRRDVANLKVISQDNILWSATQMEVEMLRFQLSVATVGIERTDESLESMLERFDILWSRVFMIGSGRVGALMREYDEGHGALAEIGAYLRSIDPVLAELRAGDRATIRAVLEKLQSFQHQLRLYTLRVVRGDIAASAQVRDRIQTSSQATAIISLVAVLVSVLSLFLILRENRRQQELAEMSRRNAVEAEQSSRAKSRFLSMMSHELRNPLNGVLGPLALLEQSDLAARQKRLVVQARECGRSMVQMLSGLLDYAELQDGRLQLSPEPFAVEALAASLREAGGGRGDFDVRILPGVPDRLRGDSDRMRQIFVHLVEYIMEGGTPTRFVLTLAHDGANLVGEIAFDGAGVEWKLDLLTGLSDIAPDQVSTDALRPLIARGLISASEGMMTLLDRPDGRRAIRVAIPAEPLRVEPIRVRLETRSAALATIYRAALRSDRVVFADGEDGPVDFVLVDSTSVGEEPLMARLRRRFPEALFVSLGLPRVPDFFDDVVETPHDMTRLRSSILGRVAFQ
jgi:signal transduction histidine kinase